MSILSKTIARTDAQTQRQTYTDVRQVTITNMKYFPRKSSWLNWEAICKGSALRRCTRLSATVGLLTQPRISNWNGVFQIFVISCVTYLSKVITTKFHVEESKNPHSRNLVFHKRHSTRPSTPVLWTLCSFWSVRLVRKNTIETAKSRILCNASKHGYF